MMDSNGPNLPTRSLQGNVCLSDGSVQQFSSSRLKDALKNTDDARNQEQFPGDETQ
jgi:hypothetical protein